MISKKEIDNILSGYDQQKLAITTICSHTALQIFHGARLEGFRTLGICTNDRKPLYESFDLAKPDEFLIVQRFEDVLEPKTQAKLIGENAVVVPHGSFVEYVGPEKILEDFAVPMFGNRQSLLWETNRRKQREWLEAAGLKMPKECRNPEEIDRRVFVKLPGAKGGRGFFTANSSKEFKEKLIERVNQGLITHQDAARFTIQEFIPGVRYYPHYFRSSLGDHGTRLRNGSIELLSMDKRIEPIDESYRGLPDVPAEFFDYTVTGNQPIVIRESLLPEILQMGVCTIEKSVDLFPPGLIGPFSLEAIYHPDHGFTVFEISARIVAGTNLYPLGSPYSAYLYAEPMSTGRRIARELKSGLLKKSLWRIVS